MKLTNNDQIQIKFLLGRSLFLGGGISLMLTFGDKDAYLAIILGFLIGIPLIYLYSKLSFKERLNEAFNNDILGIILKWIYLLFCFFIIFFLLIIFSIFIYSFYLPFMPTLLSCTPFLFLAIYLSTKKIIGIKKVAKILFYLNLSLLILKYSMLAPSLDMTNFLPLYTITPKNLIFTSLIFAIFTTSPYLLLINEPCSFKTNILAYLCNSFIIMLMLFYLIGVFGSALAKTFSYPEFSILRQINVFNFIQNIESFLALNWLFDIFIALALATLKVKENLNYKNNSITYGIGFILIYLVNKLIISNYIHAIFIYNLSTFIFAFFIIVLLSLLGLKKRFSKN